MQIGLLSNLRAGRSDAMTTRLLRYLRDFPEVATVETSAAAAVPEALAALAERDIDLLVVNGGDGTLVRTLTEVLGNRPFGDRVPLIAPLRGGRTNMSARDLGANSNPLKGLAEVLQSTREDRIEERISRRRVLRVDYRPFGDPVYGMFFGAGMIHRAIGLVHQRFPAQSGQGVLGSTLLTGALIGRTILGDREGVLTPDKIDLLLDGKPAQAAEFTLLIASTLNRLFSGMQPFWGHGPGDLRITGISPHATGLASAAVGILRGRPQPWVRPENGYTSENVQVAELRMSCGFTVDGELHDPGPDAIVSVTARDSVRFVRT